MILRYAMHMVSFALFFTLGVWYLQQQAALPALPAYWPFAIIVLLLPRTNSRMLLATRRVTILLCAALLGFSYAAWVAQRQLSDALPDEWQGKNIEIAGVVAEMPRLHERGMRFTFDVESVQTEGAHVPRHIQLSTYDGDSSDPLELSAGQRWQLTVRLKQPHGTSNPYNFDFEAWALERDIRAIGYVYAKGDNRMLSEQTSSPAYLVQRLRETVRSHFRKTLGDVPYAGVLTALAIGDQSGIAQADWQVFTRTGVNHLMSISGLHITMLAGMVFALVYWLWRRSIRLTLWFPARKAAVLAGLVAAIFYTLVSGYEVPAQRTLYMLATVGVMLRLSRNVSPSQLLATALMVVLLADPWAVLSPGFWLSFGAVALIFYVTANRLRKQHWLREYGKVQWAMMIGLIPPLLAMFQQLSLVSPIANAFAIPLVSFVVVPLTLFGTLPPFEWMLYVAHEAMVLCMYLLNLLDRLPYGVWAQHAPPAWTIVFGMGGALWMLAPRGFPMRWLGVFLLLPMFLVAPGRPAEGGARVIVFDVGQGLSVAVQTRNHALLYDTGPDFSGESDSGSRIIIPALRGMGIPLLDVLVLSHGDMDHIGGTESVLKGIPVTNVISSLPNSHPKLQLAAHNEPCADGQSWEWDGVHFDMLHPARSNTPAIQAHNNEGNCVLRVSTGQNSVLLTGDIESLAESRLMRLHEKELPVTLLVVPHHGSLSSSSQAFVDAIHPRYAMFTSGYLNRFGHPREEIVDRYRTAGSEVLRSDRDGAVTIGMDARNFGLERYRTVHARYWQDGITPSAEGP